MSPAIAAAIHGMLVLGSQHIYLSHLPMFHRPHDYQLIVEAELDPASATIYREDVKAHPDQKIYTIVPEKFVLPDVAAHPRPLQAELYRGHFERQGTVIAAHVQLVFKQVLVFEKLDPATPRPAHYEAFVFGNPNETFLAHRITARPGFDQILKAKSATAVEGQATTLELPESDEAPLPDDATEGTAIYTEMDDLS